MIHSPGILLTLLAFALVLGPLVFVHELGHYLVGRWCGVKADEFSIGFGPELIGWTDKRGTRWKLSALPLGGFVRFAGDMNPASQPSAEWLSLPAAERARTFQAKSVLKRALIVAAGPVTNFLFAVLILAGFAYFYGDSRSIIGSVMPGSAAATAQLRAGDRITSLDGVPVGQFEDMLVVLADKPGKRVAMVYERDGVSHAVTVQVGARTVALSDGTKMTTGLLGVGRAQVGVLGAPLAGVRQTGQIVARMGEGIGQIVAGQRSAKELGGPIAIAQVSGAGLAAGPSTFLYLIAMISINLGFINLLPVPVLDGGHLLFYAIEGIRRRPVEPHVQEWAFRGGLAAILALMLLVTFNDLGNFGVWKYLTGLNG